MQHAATVGVVAVFAALFWCVWKSTDERDDAYGQHFDERKKE